MAEEAIHVGEWSACVEARVLNKKNNASKNIEKKIDKGRSAQTKLGKNFFSG